jgi:delta 1-pyrroline-5-carboxylate dehydrogenase
VAQAERYADTTLLGARMTLIGYVGESNELRLRPRGVLRATARSAAALLAQLAAALATGNTLSRRATPSSPRRCVRRCRAATRDWLPEQALRHEAVLVDAAEARLHPQWLRALCQQLAARGRRHRAGRRGKRGLRAGPTAGGTVGQHQHRRGRR